jgi:hypothetical protein
MTLQCQRPGARVGLRAGNSPGNGHGVQLSSGRLVMPMYAGAPAGASICYSDDHGKIDVSHAVGPWGMPTVTVSSPTTYIFCYCASPISSPYPLRIASSPSP